MTHPAPLPACSECGVCLGWCSACGLAPNIHWVISNHGTNYQTLRIVFHLVWLSSHCDNILMFNSLAPGRCGSNFASVFGKCILQNDILNTFCDIGLRWMSQNITDDKSTLVQVKAWATSQQAITWANVDPDLGCRLASLGHSVLTFQKISDFLKPLRCPQVSCWLLSNKCSIKC